MSGNGTGTEGSGELTTATSDGNVLPLLSDPMLAAAIGLALGIALLVVSRAVSRLVTPEDPELGFAKVAVAMVIRLALVVAALVVFYVFARPGLMPFGIALVAGFFVMVTFELFGVSRTVGRQ